MPTTSDPVIVVEGISKYYRLGATIKHDTLRDAVSSGLGSLFARGRSDAAKKSAEGFWALKDVSFSVREGEVVGIIGRNGAGKSTLLKILSRITDPTHGVARLRGRVASLLEVGTGFHPELSGRENIFLNGAILGMRKEEIRRKFDEIVEFAEIERFLDTPVKRYSSGMYVRLAFAVAAHLDPEILIVDEVLAVGDAAFQKKCLGRMGDVSKSGRTVLFVSHNMAAVENLCKKCMFIDKGRLTYIGETSEAISRYMEGARRSLSLTSLSEREDRSGNGAVRFSGFRVEDKNGRPAAVLRSGGDYRFIFSYINFGGPRIKDVSVGFSFSTKSGQQLFVLYSSYTGKIFSDIPTKGEFNCLVKKFPLSPGRYLVGARITVGGYEADWPTGGIATFDVEAGDFYGTGNCGYNREGTFLVDGTWEMEEIDEGIS